MVWSMFLGRLETGIGSLPLPRVAARLANAPNNGSNPHVRQMGETGPKRHPSRSIGREGFQAGTAFRQKVRAPRFKLSKWTNRSGVKRSVTAVAKVNPPMMERAMGM